MEQQSIKLAFANNAILADLYGEQDKNLKKLQDKLGVNVSSRGGNVSISGAPKSVAVSKAVLRQLYERLNGGEIIPEGEIDAMIRMLSQDDEARFVEKKVKRKKENTHKNNGINGKPIATLKKSIKPYTPTQADYLESLNHYDVVFGSGPAGTGKTYLAVAVAVSKFISGEVERIILSRPAVEAGENLGFLPGDLKEKVDPYLQPLYDALYDFLGPEKTLKLIEIGEIEVAPLAFMRGRTLRNAAVILDEAQNTTPAQMKMFLTRLGEGTSMTLTGDLSQTDLPKGQRSGFRDALEILGDVTEIKIIHFSGEDVVRHPLTEKIVNAYERFEDDSKWKRPR